MTTPNYHYTIITQSGSFPSHRPLAEIGKCFTSRDKAETRLADYLLANADNPYSLDACHNPRVIAQPVEIVPVLTTRRCKSCGDWLNPKTGDQPR